MKRILFLAFSMLMLAGIACAQLSWSLPLRNMELSSGFGYRIHPILKTGDHHKGVDLRARSEPVFAILPGRVSACGFHAVLGNYIRISHNGLESIYGHLSSILVATGQELAAGDWIAVTGNTGRSTGEHLHFSISYQGEYLDPIQFLFKISVRSP